MEVNRFFRDYEIEKLTGTEKEIINYIQSHPFEFFNGSIKQIANEVKTSIAVISRLHSKMGFNSLKDMQFYIYHRYLNFSENKINNETQESVVLNNLLNYYRYSIIETSRIIDINKISKISKNIFESKKIFLYGVGSSFLAANELGANLQKIGKNATNFYEFHAFLLSLASVNKDETKIILFSKTCKTKEIQFIIKILEEKEIPFVIITANKNIANQYSDVIIYETLEQNKRFNSITSKISQQLVCDIIFQLIRLLEPNFDSKLKENIRLLNLWNNLK